MFSPATQPPPRGPPRHNFVSAITFKGFKLRSSNLTHALLIQISRTSSIIDIVVPSKMAAGGHFVKKKKGCVLILNGQKCDRKLFRSPEIRSKVIFRHPKWPPKKKILYRSEMARIAIESEFRKSKMADRSEMARNAIESEFGHPKWPPATILSKISKKK